MSITSTGNGLNIILLSDYNFHNDWQTFASWYSINRFLPDTDVSVYFPKSTTSSNLFKWMKKVNIKKHKQLSFPTLIMNCGTMAVREICFLPTNGQSKDDAVKMHFNDLYEKKEIDGLCCDCLENETTTFVQVNTCGHYDKKTWQKQAKSPFEFQLNKDELSINEIFVLRLWKQMANLYSVINH